MKRPARAGLFIRGWLAAVAMHALALVYEHIGGTPSLEDFILDRERALEGPGSESG